MKCEIVTGNMPQLWEDLLSQLHEKEYPSESIRHYREAMGRVDRYMRENQILEYTEAVGETYLATHGGRISSGRQFYMSFYVRRLNDMMSYSFCQKKCRYYCHCQIDKQFAGGEMLSS